MAIKQLLVVPSADPAADIKFLVARFSGVFNVIDDEYTLEAKYSVLMLMETQGVVPSKPVVTWATDVALPTANFGASQTLISLKDGLQICRFSLPSGTILLQCSNETSASDHRQLAQFIRGGSVIKAPEKPLYDPEAVQLPEPLVLPRFPTIDVKLLGPDGSYAPFPLNSPIPIPVETDLFRGKVLVVLRPSNPAKDDPYWNERVFAQRQRRCIIQLQGKFLRQPQGVLYAGGQVSDPMQLGLITRGVCSVLLRLVESFQKQVHYSYGSSTELAHIVAPAHSFFERVVVTPEGEPPPPMEDTFPETPEAMAQRKAAATFEWNTSDTYSFSFFSMYIDLVRWKLVNIPATGDLSLQTFWGSSFLNICMYEKIGSTTRHLDSDNKYAFSIRAQYLGDRPSTDINESRRGGEGSDTESVTLFPWPERRREPSVGSVPEVESPEREIPRSESQVFTSVDLSSLSPVQHRDELSVQEEENELNFFDAEQGRDESTSREIDPISASELLRLVDLVCPFWIEQHKGNSSVTLFAINKDSETTFRRSRSCEDLVLNAMSRELSKKVKQGSPRLSSLERLRRSIGIMLLDPGMSDLALEAINSFHIESESVAVLPTGTILQQDTPTIAGTLGRAVSDRHWVEEWVAVSTDALSLLFFRNSERRRHHFHVKLSTVSQIEELSTGLAPQAFGFFVLSLATIGRTLYLMMASKEERNTWAASLRGLVQQASTHEAESGSSVEANVLRLHDMESIASEFLHNSTMWKCKNRRILNCGSFHFREGNDLSVQCNDVVAMSQQALISTIGAQTEGLEDAQRRRSFLDNVARLKAVSLEGLDEDTKLVFFINLYHVMVSHAFLILGPPNSSLKWFKYFNNIAYQVSDDIFSLTELEHCILRANMTYPSQLLSKFVIPKTKFKCALDSTNDCRINFALNCGSTSNPPNILVYETETLDHQLDEASRICLKSTTSRMTSSGTLALNLPRIVQWFADDFGDDQTSRINALRPFLPVDIQREMGTARRFELKYQSFSFECQPVTIHTSSMASKNMSSSTT